MISRACLKAARVKRDLLKTLRADPYYLGDEAWHFGAPEKGNPFTAGTEEYADWLKGWRDVVECPSRRLVVCEGGPAPGMEG